MDYINTSHPNFVGGSKEVEIALQQVKSSKIASTIPKQKFGCVESISGEEDIPRLKRPFVVVYIHTGVCKSENFSGISFLWSVYDSIPVTIKQNLETVYFVHPDLQSRLFLATFGHFIFTVGYTLYSLLHSVPETHLTGGGEGKEMKI
ncbi:putative CRAL-TRIO lipid binding domain-containing protein [Helianthus anomalus]